MLVGADSGGAALRDRTWRRDLRHVVVSIALPKSSSLRCRSAIALVYPSRYEGFGLPLVEAMASGTPVIAAATSSIPEVVGAGGLLLDPDDEGGWREAVRRLIEDRAFGGQMREAGIARAAAFSWKRTAEETARVYRELLPTG